MFLKGMVGVTPMDRINIDLVQFRIVMVRILKDRVDLRVLRWFEHMVRWMMGYW